MAIPSAWDAASKEDIDLFPASFAQQRLWFLDQAETNVPSASLSSTVHISIVLERKALEQSLNALVQRYTVLRTTFLVKDGQLVQVINPTLTVPLRIVDGQSFPANQREAMIEQVRLEDLQQPFDLARGPLLRTTLLQLNENDAVLLLTSHHLIFDGWSMGEFFRAWSTLYEAFCHNQPSTLPEPPLQYTDFARWQHVELVGDKLATHLAYWKHKLAGIPPVLELPTDHPHPTVPTQQSGILSFEIAPCVGNALADLSRQEGVSLLTLAVAAFQTLLHRYIGQDDLLIGTMVSERTQPQFRALLGVCLNPLVLRTNLSNNPTFRELVGRVREVVDEAQAHQDVPFEYVVKELQPERAAGHPFFQVLLTLQPSWPTLPSGWTFTHMQVQAGANPFDLSLELDAEGFNGRLRYNRDLFDAPTITRMVGHWQTLLASIVAAPDQRINDLLLLTQAERQQLMVEWNATETDYPHDQCFHELFEAQVERTPDSIAAVCGQEHLTYRELNRRANQLARELQTLGVEPETIVPLLAERSIAFLLAMLAVFKAGGAYLPLDPHHPPSRIRQILEHSRARLVLATKDFASLLTQALNESGQSIEAGPEVVYFEDLFSSPEHFAGNVPTNTAPSNLAYVIYTSGSTGLPKGVMIEQRGMVNHLYAKVNALNLTALDGVAQTASQCFDISVWQFLSALLVGGRVHIFSDDVAHHPAQLLKQVEQQQITILETVPSLLRMMLETVERDGSAYPRLEMLRWLVPTGEALPPAFCRRWLTVYPHIPLLNAYGPTECSDDVTHFPIAQPLADTLIHTPIGRPIMNMHMYILDKQLKPLPIGVNGELYVGGVGVGRGYLYDEERTADAYVADPFSPEPGKRLYKTGDLARYLSNGTIEFLGRIDHQVKIRGNRIELGEIEVRLRHHASVKDVTVIVREDTPGDQSLVAYAVASTPVSSEELRHFLQEQLPDYMVPSAFVLLKAMPLTPNGKIDRKALPVPDFNDREQKDSFVAPHTPLEMEVANSWADVLGIEQVGLNDNFVALGGHSLLAMQITARLRTTLNIDIPLRSFFESPTLAQLIEAIEHLQAQGAKTRISGLRPRSRDAYRVSASSMLSMPSSNSAQNEEKR